MEEKTSITLDEFKAWLAGLIVGKQGVLPDTKDWKRIKEMLDKVEPEVVQVPVPSNPLPITPPLVPDPYDPYRWPQTPQWPSDDPYRWDRYTVSPNTNPITTTGDPIPQPGSDWCSVSTKTVGGWLTNGEYKEYSVQINMEDFIPENAFITPFTPDEQLEIALDVMSDANK